MAAPPLWLILSTVGVYSGFLIGFGETILDLDYGSCSSITTCSTWIFNFVGSMFSLITLGGFSSPLPALLQAPLLLFFGASWGFFIFDAVTKMGNLIPFTIVLMVVSL